MEPLIAEGARAEVSAPAGFYWPGDVVVFLAATHAFTLHRVLGCYRRRGEWKFVTQGDRALRPDAAVTAGQILGRVTGGECAPALYAVPLRTRFWAAARFAVHAVATTLRRVWAHGLR